MCKEQLAISTFKQACLVFKPLHTTHKLDVSSREVVAKYDFLLQLELVPKWVESSSSSINEIDVCMI